MHKKSTKNILIGSGIAAAITGIGFLYHASANALMKVALDREEPKSTSKAKKS